MLCFHFFKSAKKMATEVKGKKQTICYKYNVAQSTISEGVSVTLKEMSMQMADEDERHRMYALLTCIITVVFDIFLGIAAFVCAAVTDSSAGYAFALDCLLDVLAATLVVWRFYGSTSTHSDFKENVACICLGILFCLSSVGIIAKSAHDLAIHHIPQQLMYVFILAGVGGVMNSVLGCAKYMLGKKMKSQSLILEAINTSLSAVLAMMLAVSDILYFYHPSAWTIDPITSIVVAVILFVGGLKVRQRILRQPYFEDSISLRGCCAGENTIQKPRPSLWGLQCERHAPLLYNKLTLYNTSNVDAMHQRLDQSGTCAKYSSVLETKHYIASQLSAGRSKLTISMTARQGALPDRRTEAPSPVVLVQLSLFPVQNFNLFFVSTILNAYHEVFL